MMNYEGRKPCALNFIPHHFYFIPSQRRRFGVSSRRHVSAANNVITTLRALLVLGRVSNLPTVWSNCFAGWLLGGGGDVAGLLRLIAGATLVYVGGMYLNDAFDAEFDRRHRTERPIPAGAVSEVVVWACGLGWLLAGGVVLALDGWESAVYSAVLVMAVLVYDAVHKQVEFAPLLMAICRFLLYLLGCAAGVVGVTGYGIWAGVALAAYVVGLSYLARREATGGVFENWPLVLLAAPVVLAVIVGDFEHRVPALLLSFGVLTWMLWALHHTLVKTPPRIGATVGDLLAGIALLDWLAVGWVVMPSLGHTWTSWQHGAVFVALFLLAKLAQRVVPAT